MLSEAISCRVGKLTYFKVAKFTEACFSFFFPQSCRIIFTMYVDTYTLSEMVKNVLAIMRCFMFSELLFEHELFLIEFYVKLLSLGQLVFVSYHGSTLKELKLTV